VADTSETQSDFDKLDTIIESLERSQRYAHITTDRHSYAKRADTLDAKIELYTALRDSLRPFTETITNETLAQGVARENYPMLVPALRLAELEGLI
jgi:hypothetical protein